MPTDLLASVTLHQLRVLSQVAAHRSFSKAGEALYLSQPAISDHIKELEHLVGFKLFDRSPGRKHAELTEAGRVLLRAFEGVSRTLKAAGAELEAFRGTEGSRLVIGAGALFSGSMLPRILESFRRSHPQVTVFVQVDQRQRILEGLIRFDLDLAVLTSPIEDTHLDHESIGGYDMILVGPLDHRLARAEGAPFYELAAERLVLPERTTGFRKVLERMAAEADISLHVIWEVSDVSARIQAATSGLGIAALSTQSAAAEVAAGRLSVLPVQGFPVHMDWRVVFRPGQLRPPIQAFREHLLGAGREMLVMNSRNGA